MSCAEFRLPLREVTLDRKYYLTIKPLIRPISYLLIIFHLERLLTQSHPVNQKF